MEKLKRIVVNLCLVMLMVVGGITVVNAGSVPSFHSFKIYRGTSYKTDTHSYNKTSGRSSVGIYVNSTIKSGDTVRVRLVDGDGVYTTEYVDFSKGNVYKAADYYSGISTKVNMYLRGRLMTGSSSESMSFSYGLTP